MESLNPDSLTPAQVQVVAALVQGATVTDAAKSAGVHRTIIYNWLQNQLEFQTAVEGARAEYAATLRDELQVLSRNALATLRSLLDDPGTPRTLRVRVAMAILQRPQSPEHDWNLPEPASGLQEIHPRDDSEAVSEVSNVSEQSNISELR